MVDPARIRHRIEKFKIDGNLPGEREHAFIDIYVDGRVKWYLSFSLQRREFHLIGDVANFGKIKSPTQQGRFRDYLISLLPPEIVAAITARAINYRPHPDSLPF